MSHVQGARCRGRGSVDRVDLLPGGVRVELVGPFVKPALRQGLFQPLQGGLVRNVDGGGGGRVCTLGLFSHGSNSSMWTGLPWAHGEHTAPARLRGARRRVPGPGRQALAARGWPRRTRSWTTVAKDAAPSTELRVWYNRQPDRFDEFRQRYLHELEDGQAAAGGERLRALVAEHPDVDARLRLPGHRSTTTPWSCGTSSPTPNSGSTRLRFDSGQVRPRLGLTHDFPLSAPDPCRRSHRSQHRHRRSHRPGPDRRKAGPSTPSPAAPTGWTRSPPRPARSLLRRTSPRTTTSRGCSRRSPPPGASTR